MNTAPLKIKAAQLRLATWKLIYQAKTGHTGSDLSCADILTVLYNHVLHQTPATFHDVDVDRYIQSKGHAVEILYCTLADRGYFDQAALATYSQFNSPFIGHPTNHINGIELNTGSLGHGLALSVGMALAAKQDGRQHQVYTLMGDGEQAEGSVWEAAMAASQYQLDNLCAIIDHNHLQISGTTEAVMNSNSLEAKYTAFGFDVLTVDGNDIDGLLEAFSTPHIPGKPRLILAETTKGKGISFAENQANWHHRVPTPDEYTQGCAELDAEIKRWQHVK